MDLSESVFETGEVAINYAEGPRHGPPFVILHGGAARWQHTRDLVEALTTSWHVYAPDFRGHGLSGRVPGAYRLPDYVRDTAAFLQAVVQEPAVIYGHSMGGEVAVMLAAQQPQLVRALIVGDAPLSNRNQATEQPTHRAQNVLWHSLAGRPEAEIERAHRQMPMLEPGFLDRAPRSAEEVMGVDCAFFAHQATSLHQLDPDMLAAVLEGPESMLPAYDPEVLLPAITCPVLLIQADPRQGSALPDAELALALSLLRDGTHERLDGHGHALHAPPGGTARVLEALAPFLQRLAVAATSPAGV